MGGLGSLYFTKQAEWNEIVGNRILQRRIERGLSQEALAILAEISVRSVARYETGETCPESHTLYRIGRALSVDLSYFYGSIRAAEHAIF